MVYVFCLGLTDTRLTEINFEQALKEAAELDERFAAKGQVVGPLHGIPISVKVRCRSVTLCASTTDNTPRIASM